MPQYPWRELGREGGLEKGWLETRRGWMTREPEQPRPWLALVLTWVFKWRKALSHSKTVLFSINRGCSWCFFYDSQHRISSSGIFFFLTLGRHGISLRKYWQNQKQIWSNKISHERLERLNLTTERCKKKLGVKWTQISISRRGAVIIILVGRRCIGNNTAALLKLHLSAKISLRSLHG